jgi:hypothetical protein
VLFLNIHSARNLRYVLRCDYITRRVKETFMIHSNGFRRLALVFFALLLALISTVPVQAQEPVVVEITTTSVTVDEAGNLIVTTFFTCSEPAQAVVSADASQQVGRTLVFGTGEPPDLLACGPTGTTVTFTITPQVGTFRQGRVNIVARAFVCAPDFFICSGGGQDSTEQTLIVRRSP